MQLPCYLSVHHARGFSLQISILITKHLSTFCCVTIMVPVLKTSASTDLNSVFLDKCRPFLTNCYSLRSSCRQNASLQTCIRKSNAELLLFGKVCSLVNKCLWHHRVIDIKFACTGCLKLIRGDVTAFLDNSVCGSLQMPVGLHVRCVVL